MTIPGPSKKIAGAALLVLMTVAVYLPGTQNEYIWDDDFYVSENQTLRTLDGLRQIWFDVDATPQ